MCDKCTELDKKIEQYKELAARLLDPPTIEGIKKLIDEMVERKAQLHPE
jgi:hypothetical protein